MHGVQAKEGIMPSFQPKLNRKSLRIAAMKKGKRLRDALAQECLVTAPLCRADHSSETGKD